MSQTGFVDALKKAGFSKAQSRYWWCKRTGHGDIATATKAARKYYELPGADQSGAAMEGKAVMSLLDGDRAAGLAAMNVAFHLGGQPWHAMHVALLKLQDRPEQAQTAFELVDVQKENPRSGKPSKELAKLFLECVNAGADKKLQQDRVDAILKNAGARERSSLYYFVGKFCEIRGERDLALANYTLCVKTAPRSTFNWMLSADALSKHKIDPYKISPPENVYTATGEPTTQAVSK